MITRYEAFKKGDYAVARNPIPKELADSSSGGGALSLIDLDDGETAAPLATGSSTTVNDLSDLFSSPPAPKPIIQHQPLFGIGTGISLQPQPPSNTGSQQPQPLSPVPILANSGFTGSSIPPLQQRPSHTATPPASIMLPATPNSQRSTPAPATQGPNYFGRIGTNSGPQIGGSNFGTGPQNQPGASFFGSSQPQLQQPSFGFGTSLQPQIRPQVQAHPAVGATTTQQNKDPFADLAGLF